MEFNETRMRTDFEEHCGVWYGSTLIVFTVHRRKRKTLEIAVLPNRHVEVTAPLESTEDAIREKVKKRAGWIVKQKNWFQKFGPRTPDRQYLGGETHLYLGKRYRLKISTGDKNQVKLSNGYFDITIQGDVSTEAVHRLLEQWYRKQASKHYKALLEELRSSFNLPSVPRLQIRAMRTRWGSLSQTGILTLNTSLIRAPKECIRYVVTHELCHVAHHNHSPDFFKLLASRMPDWEEQKLKLEQALI